MNKKIDENIITEIENKINQHIQIDFMIEQADANLWPKEDNKFLVRITTEYELPFFFKIIQIVLEDTSI